MTEKRKKEIIVKFEGSEIIEREVSKFGTGAHVIVPKEYAGKKVKIILGRKKMRKSNILILLGVLTMFLLVVNALGFVNATPSINFTAPTLQNGTIVNVNSIKINTITNESDTDFKNYTYYLYNSTGLVTINKYSQGEVGVSLGFDFTCFLKQNGSVQCQGDNDYGQSNNYSGTDVIQISTGNSHTCFLKQNGSVQCQGDNYYGRANNYLGTDIIQVSAGWRHTCFLKQNGSVQCQGDNDYGQSNNYSGTDVIQISSGDHSTCFLKQNGSVQCQGQNIAGQINPYSGTDVIQISTGNSHTCFLKQNGSVQCQGYNVDGQANNYSGTDVIQISSEGYHTCFLKQNGSVQCQGDNTYNQSNNYTGTDIIRVSARWRYTCFLKQNGSVSCQGYPASGQSDTYAGTDVKKTAFYTFQNLADGTYYINATVCDVAGNCSYTETRSVGIDLTYPTINFTAPTEISGTILIGRNNIQINITSNDTNFANITISLYNSTRTLINSTNITLTNLFINFTGLPDDTYYFNATACDMAYNCNSTDTRNVTIDITAPNATILAPQNATITNEPWQGFAINISDNQGLSNATLYLYNETGLYNQTTVGLNGVTQTVAGVFIYLADGVYHWSWEVVDLANNIFTTQSIEGNRTITADATNPFVSIVYPESISYNAAITSMNYTLTEINPSSCWFYNGTRNNTITCWENITTNLMSSEGSNTWIVYANDSAGNENSSSVTFFVDSINPGISIVYPINNTNFTVSTIEINYTVSDSGGSGLSSCKWTNNSGLTNTTINCGTNITYLANQGTNTINVYVNDSVGNINSSAVTFFVDTIYPTFSDYWDNNATVVSSGIGLFNVTLTDTNGTVILNINNTNYTATNITSSIYNISVNLTAGTYTYYWFSYGNGTLNNYNSSILRYYTVNESIPVDTIYPTFSDYYDNNASLADNGTGLFNVTVFNTNGTVWLEINNINITATNITENIYNVSYYFTSNGIYEYIWHAYGNGTSNNENNSEIRYYVVNTSADITPPIITIISPENITYNTTVTGFNVTLDENGSWCGYSLDEAENISMAALNSTSFWEINSTMTEGSHNVMFSCNDTFGNMNSSSLRYFSINTTLNDSEGPVFTNLINQTIQDNQTLSYTLTATDNSGISCFTVNDTANFDINCSGFLTNATKLNVEIYWINITVNDTLNNTNSGVIYINVTDSTIPDITPPDINFIDPTDTSGIIINRSNIVVNTIASDSGVGLANISVWLYNASGALITSQFSLTSPLFINFTELVNGIYYFNATACDILNNCKSTETRNVTLNLTATTIPSTPSGGGGGGSTKRKASINIIVPSTISVKEAGKMEFSINLENDGDVDFNDVSITGYLVGDSEPMNVSVIFDTDFIKSLGKGKKETLLVTTFIENDNISFYEVVINVTSKTPVYNTYKKVFIIFLLARDKMNILKIIAFNEKFINENAQCMELNDMIEDAKKELAAGNLEEAKSRAQAAIEACQRTIGELEKPRAATSKNEKIVYYFIIAVVSAIIAGLLFNIYRQRRFRSAIFGEEKRRFVYVKN